MTTPIQPCADEAVIFRSGDHWRYRSTLCGRTWNETNLHPALAHDVTDDVLIADAWLLCPSDVGLVPRIERDERLTTLNRLYGEIRGMKDGGNHTLASSLIDASRAVKAAINALENSR